ncbi:MAG: DUF488 family protein [Opitutales bacterium]
MSENLPVHYTVGHSVHPIDHFIKILKMNRIDAIADVRSSPYSKFTPQFNRESLKKSLKDHGVRYVFLGDELGARRDEPDCYDANKVVYRKVADLPSFKAGILRLREGAEKMRVATMCAEKDPLTCHRTVLVTHFSREFFSDTLHILEDGSIESRAEADLRLLREYKLEKEDFFSPYEERLALAYSKRAEKIAYEENQDQVAYG